MPKPATPEGDDGVEVIDLAAPNVDPTKTPAAEPEDDGSTPDTPAQIAARAKAVKDVAAEAATTGDADPDADPAAAAAAAAAPGAKGGKAPPSMIPAGRFNEVNERMQAAEAQNKLLLEAIAKGPAATPAVAATPAAPEFDRKKAMKEQLAALASGDDDKALELGEQIYQHQMAEAKKQAKAEVEEATTLMTARQSQDELTRAGADIKKTYPELDGKSDKANEDAITYVIAKRDLLVAKGMLAHNALRDASEQAAKLFGFGKPAAEVVVDDPTAARTLAARTKAAAAVNAAPPDLGGVGDRATAPTRKKIEEMTDAQLKALPKAELDKLDGSA